MARKNILFVIDYQNDFVDGSLGFPAAKALEDKLAEQIKFHINQGGTVVFTYDTHNRDYLETTEGRNLPVEHCIDGTFGWQLHGKVKEIHDWAVDNHKHIFDIRKPTFGSLGIINAIQDVMQYTGVAEEDLSMEFCGVVTNICVISNIVVAKATAPEARIFVNSDLCASNDTSLEEKAYDIIRNLHVDVI